MLVLLINKMFFVAAVQNRSRMIKNIFDLYIKYTLLSYYRVVQDVLKLNVKTSGVLVNINVEIGICFVI